MPGTVLIVDDHPLVRAALADVLNQQADFTVVGCASDAAGGVAAAHRRQPDLIVLDHHLPGQSGLEALPAFRAAAPHAGVLVWTAGKLSPQRVQRHGPRVGLITKDRGLAAVTSACRQLLATPSRFLESGSGPA